MTYKPSIPFVAALVILTGLICRMEDFIPPVPAIQPDPLVVVVNDQGFTLTGFRQLPAFFVHIDSKGTLISTKHLPGDGGYIECSGRHPRGGDSTLIMRNRWGFLHEPVAFGFNNIWTIRGPFGVFVTCDDPIRLPPGKSLNY